MTNAACVFLLQFRQVASHYSQTPAYISLGQSVASPLVDLGGAKVVVGRESLAAHTLWRPLRTPCNLVREKRSLDSFYPATQSD